MKKSNAIVPELILAFFLVLLISAVAVTINSLNGFMAVLDAKSGELATQENRYNYDLLANNVNALKESAQKLNIKPVSSTNAIINILEYADRMNKEYKANMTRPITDTGSEFNVQMSFSFRPNKPDEFIKLLEHLFNQGAPIVYIQRVVLTGRTDEKGNPMGHVADITIDLTQPYTQVDDEKGK